MLAAYDLQSAPGKSILLFVSRSYEKPNSRVLEMHGTLQANSSVTRQQYISSAQEFGLLSHDATLPGVLLRKFSNDILNRKYGQGWKRTRMFLSMTYQSRFLHKGLSTYIARIGPFARVNQDMLLQTTRPGKGTTADRTCERLDTTMVNSQVEVETAFRFECLPTSGTRDLLILLVP